jgi:hypothetical protein
MKSAFVATAAAALFLLVGCNNGTPGGPGVDKNKPKKVGQTEETFKLSLPETATKIKQGETKDVTIGIKRGKNIDEDVTIKFEDVPKGVTLDPSSPTIKHGDTEAKVNVKAADDAALGSFKVKVIGKPGKGEEARNDLDLTISKK